uniref:Uncharacterized protein n=1 Tax=Meloidogyne incognita TaxID=6306 RepID=A0A914M4P3_MELIC
NFYWIRQNRLSKNQLDQHHSRFNHIHSRHTSPVLENNSSSVSLSPACEEYGFDHLQELRNHVANNNKPTAFGITNEHFDRLDFGSLRKLQNQTTVLIRKKQQQLSSSSSNFRSGCITEGTISRGVLTINTANDKYSNNNLNSDDELIWHENGLQKRDNNNAINADLNAAAACRSITEIYRSAEMKLKNMMPNEQNTPRKTEFKSEYSIPASKQQSFDEKYKEVLTGCVNKIRGYGTRKLTEQEMLRWRQLKLVNECRTVEDMHKLTELPEYRLQFTKLKWIQIVQCMAEALLDDNETHNLNDNRLDEKRIGDK